MKLREVVAVYKPEVWKYTMRFLVPLLIAWVLFLTVLEGQSFKLVVYKLTMICVAASFAEFLWALFFKRVVGKMEVMPTKEALTWGVFRGLWDGSIILAFTLGL